MELLASFVKFMATVFPHLLPDIITAMKMWSNARGGDPDPRALIREIQPDHHEEVDVMIDRAVVGDEPVTLDMSDSKK